MASNYQYDPKNISSVNNPATPASGPSGTEPEFPLPSQIMSQSAVPHLPDSSSISNGAQSAQQGTPSTPGSGGSSTQLRLSSGTELSGARYKIEKLVAAGGMGAVYRAIDTRFNRPCAVKEMLDTFQTEGERTQAIEWFEREATFLLDLNHPCIPRVRDFFVEAGRHYLVMDFIEGRTMGDILEAEGNVPGAPGVRGVPEARARHWARQICSVLTYLHSQTPPVIFRDLKPTNIMVTNRDEIKLIDFGIARSLQSQRQATIIMTYGYAPQEQFLGNPEPRSDLYALGATIFRVLTRHDAANNKPNIFTFPPLRSLRPDISPGFERVIMRALEVMPENRWSSASEMEQAIASLPPPMVVPPQETIRRDQLPLPLQTSGQQPSSGPKPPMGASINLSPPSTGIANPAAPHISAAIGHITAGRIDLAYTAVQQAYVLEPNNAVVHKLFGQVFSRRQEVDRAIQAFNRSLQLNPNDPETHKLIGDILFFSRQQPHLAIPAYIQSLRLNSNNSEAHHRLGQCYERTNQLDLALREYQEAVKLAPGQAVLQYALGQLALRMRQYSIAEQAFIQVLTINRGDYNTRFLLSQVYELQNRPEEALRECEYVLGPLGAKNPQVPQMYQRLRARLGR